MKTLELIARVDENHHLTLALPPDVRPGPVKVTVEWPEDEDLDGASWTAAIAARWESDWSDAGEDIYSSEDGKPESWRPS